MKVLINTFQKRNLRSLSQCRTHTRSCPPLFPAHTAHPLTFAWVLFRGCDPKEVQGTESLPVALWNGGPGPGAAPEHSGTHHRLLGGKALGEDPPGHQPRRLCQLWCLTLGLLCLARGQLGGPCSWGLAVPPFLMKGKKIKLCLFT